MTARWKGMHRKDSNHDAVVKLVKAARPHWSIVNTHHVGGGFGDFIVGACGINVFFELKKTDKEELTEKQEEFHAHYKGQIAVVWTAQQVIEITEHELSLRRPGPVTGAI